MSDSVSPEHFLLDRVLRLPRLLGPLKQVVQGETARGVGEGEVDLEGRARKIVG